MGVLGEGRGRSFSEMKATPSGCGGNLRTKLFYSVRCFFIEHWLPCTSVRG